MDALAILQNYLDRMGAAVMAGDYDTYAAGVLLPFRLITEESELVVKTDAKLREGFDAFRDMLSSQRATNMIRIAEAAEFSGHDALSGLYKTDILRDAQRIFEPFESRIVLRRSAVGGAWRAEVISNAMRNTHWPIHLPFIRRPAPHDSSGGHR